MKKRIISIIMALFIFAGTAIPDAQLDFFTVEASAATADVGTPTNLKAKVSGTKITLTWTAVEGADAYRVYKYNSATKKYTKYKSVKGTKATVTDLGNGTYYFRVAALVKTDGKYSAGTACTKVKAKITASKTAQDIVKEMGNGWNLGNTMEATNSNAKSVSNCETAWGQPITTPEMIAGVKAAGFDSVRIPIAWSNLMSKDGKYTISQEYFDRIDEIVGYVLDNDMYCVINIHWDGGWWTDFGSSNESKRDEAMEKYTAMWTQIAKHYANYSDKLIFESANEELGDFKLLGAVGDYNKVNEINQKFVDIVRTTGGNNASRFLLIAGYNTDIDKTCSKSFVMPTDTIANHLIVSVHYYSPSPYCIAQKKDNSWGYDEDWGTKEDIAAMEKDFAKLTKFTDAGYGVIIGEYGVADILKNGVYVAKPDADKFISNVIRICDNYNFCPMIWDTGAWYNRKTCELKDKAIADIFA